MIFGNKAFIERYEFLSDDILKCFKFAKNNTIIDYEKGTYEIDGKNIFVNIVQYETKSREERFWEAHKSYIDLHLMLSGCEIIDINFIGNMKQNEYVEEDDFLPLEGVSNSHVVLNNGDFLICYPEDAHMTAISVQEVITIKKAIFKIKI